MRYINVLLTHLLNKCIQLFSSFMHMDTAQWFSSRIQYTRPL